MSNYPTSVYAPRTKTNKTGVIYDPARSDVGYAEDFSLLDAEVLAIENLLGINSDAQTIPVTGAVLKGKADGKSKWSTEIFIGATGNVGIGTTSPTQKLDVNGSAIVVDGTASNFAGFGSAIQTSGKTLGLGYDSTTDAGFIRSENSNVGWEPLYLSASKYGFMNGNVGIGTTSPNAPLEVWGTGVVSSHAVLDVKSNSTTDWAPMLNIFTPSMANGNHAGRFNFGVGEAVGSSASISFVKNATAALSYLSFTHYGASDQMVIQQSGNVGIGTTEPSAKLDINSDVLRLRTAKTPASAAAAGNTGDICWNSGFLYVCIATNTWVKTALTTW